MEFLGQLMITSQVPSGECGYPNRPSNVFAAQHTPVIEKEMDLNKQTGLRVKALDCASVLDVCVFESWESMLTW